MPGHETREAIRRARAKMDGRDQAAKVEASRVAADTSKEDALATEQTAAAKRLEEKHKAERAQIEDQLAELSSDANSRVLQYRAEMSRLEANRANAALAALEAKYGVSA